MSRIIGSPVKRFPGTVTLPDYLTYDQLFAFQDAMEQARELGKSADVLRVNRAALPGVVACVEGWHLDGIPEAVTVEWFPATPLRAAAELLSWLVNAVSALAQEADEVPNG